MNEPRSYKASEAVMTNETPTIRVKERDQDASGMPSPQRVISIWLANVLGVFALLIVFNIGRALMDNEREYAAPALTQNNMKQWGLIFKMFANESPDGSYPALVWLDGTWVPDLIPLHEKYLSDPTILTSREHPSLKKLETRLSEASNGEPRDMDSMALIMGESFAYLGYCITNESDFKIVARARASNEILGNDSIIFGEDGGPAIHPLREGVERLFITDVNDPAEAVHAQSTIPVLIEIVPWKYKGFIENFQGTNVLFMDGSVRFVRLGTFPVLPSILDALTTVE